MKKAFFSFIAVTLVALVLFMAVSYLFAFRDLRSAAQNDLEVRRVAERMEDAQAALNRTIIDAAFDAAYASYGCGVATDENAAGFCGNFSLFLGWYVANMSWAFSEESNVGITNVTGGCYTNVTNSTKPLYGSGAGAIYNNVTKNMTLVYTITVEGKNAKYVHPANYSLYADIVRSTYSAITTFGVRVRGIGANASNMNATVIFQCNG
ncbi:MAG TPA: hypothetical protein VJI13_00190 [Candidatus Norongarragalinales archaeon]|nr:hypothetical protein [Candidatus Norongarragalinales archaeon]